MERIEQPLEVLAHKIFPSGAQLTKVKVDGIVAYIRENSEMVTDGESSIGFPRQFLELSAPDSSWAKVAAIVAVEDHLKRQIRNVDFTAWAEAELTK